jgi:uncharacterized membrane protein
MWQTALKNFKQTGIVIGIAVAVVGFVYAVAIIDRWLGPSIQMWLHSQILHWGLMGMFLWIALFAWIILGSLCTLIDYLKKKEEEREAQRKYEQAKKGK